MKTSWIETKEIEEYLLGNLNPQQNLLFSAGLLINPELKETSRLQQQTYDLVKLYARRKLKKELEMVQQKIFNSAEHKDFRKKILSIFKMD